MDDRFAQALQPHTSIATDHVARLEFVNAAGEAADWVRGTVEGPFCDYARTLTTAFAIEETTRGVTIVDPCYWTPELPFFYRLQLEAEFPTGPVLTVERPIGLRRWEVIGPSVRLERKRVVLRGAAATQISGEALVDARKFESALIVSDPSEKICAKQVDVAWH